MTAQQPEAHIKEPYTLAEIRDKIASNDYSAEMLLQHAMRLLDGAALSSNAWEQQASPTAQAEDSVQAVDERDDFEQVFPLPYGCIRVGTGYASIGYSNWAAHTHCERWQGWKARAIERANGIGIKKGDRHG